jgi:hypothetical protein
MIAAASVTTPIWLLVLLAVLPAVTALVGSLWVVTLQDRPKDREWLREQSAKDREWLREQRLTAIQRYLEATQEFYVAFLRWMYRRHDVDRMERLDDATNVLSHAGEALVIVGTDKLVEAVSTVQRMLNHLFDGGAVAKDLADSDPRALSNKYHELNRTVSAFRLIARDWSDEAGGKQSSLPGAALHNDVF